MRVDLIDLDENYQANKMMAAFSLVKGRTAAG